MQARVYEMLKLDHGNQIGGPAIIEGVDTTFVVPPGQEVFVDEHLNMVMTPKG